MQKRSSGFTLVELILILLILGVVAAFIFPMFASWKTQARYSDSRSACMSNLKHVTMGMQMYVGDHDEKYPNSGVLSPLQDTGWVRALRPYIKDYEKFQCPSDGLPQDVSAGSGRLTDYYFNRRLSGIKRSEVADITYTVLFGEGEPASSNYACASFEFCTGKSPNGPVGKVPDSAKLRHPGGASYVFTSGGLKFLRPTAIRPNGTKNEYNFAPATYAAGK